MGKAPHADEAPPRARTVAPPWPSHRATTSPACRVGECISPSSVEAQIIEVIRGTQRQSEANTGNQRPADAIRRNQTQSVAPCTLGEARRGAAALPVRSRHPVAPHLMMRHAIRGHHRPSEAIRGHQRPSEATLWRRTEHCERTHRHGRAQHT